MHRPLRCPLPDQLTPAHVHALLSDLRLSASQVNTRMVDRHPYSGEHMVHTPCNTTNNVLWVRTPCCCVHPASRLNVMIH